LTSEPRRILPPVHAVIDQKSLADLIQAKGRDSVVQTVREVIEEMRRSLVIGDDVEVSVESIARLVSTRILTQRESLRCVINATGILLNTGLGRAPLATDAADAVHEITRGYCNLEFDLERGERGHRTQGVEALLNRLTGSEASAVVNNNAAATLIALRALASGREVIISRGQLIEIGGSFRLPEIFEVSGSRLREVGTTNKTRLEDYERAIGPDTAAILRVHPSNYRIVGFTEDVSIPALANLAHQHGLWMIDDIGSGAIAPGYPPLVRDEPTAVEGLEAGSDVILFSGDKLLGGPQCGILVGRSEPIAKIKKDPLMRAIRVDKMSIAALEATLRLLFDHSVANARLPLWKLLTTPVEVLRQRAELIAKVFRDSFALEADVLETTSFLGGGTTPTQSFPSVAVTLSSPFPSPWNTEAAFERALRRGDPAVVARLHGGSLLFDLKAMTVEEDRLLEKAVGKLIVSH